MWEYEFYIKQLNEIVEEENEQQRKEMDGYNINDYKRQAKANVRNLQPPKMPQINLPKMW